MLLLLWFLTIVPVSAPPLQPVPAGSDAAAQRVEGLLAAMGGREAWSRARFVHVQAVHHDLSSAEPYVNRIWNDFTSARVRIEATVDGLFLARGINREAGWRIRGTEPVPMASELFANDRAWWEANVYRTIHRLAARDPGIEPRLTGDGRLEIYRRDGTRLNWFVLNRRGEPVRFGTGDDERGTVFGPLTVSGSGIRHPRWGASADGTFRFEIVRFEAAGAAPPAVCFDRTCDTAR